MQNFLYPIYPIFVQSPICALSFSLDIMGHSIRYVIQ